MKTFKGFMAEELTGKALQNAVFGKKFKDIAGKKSRPEDMKFHLPGVGRFPSREYAKKHFPDHPEFKDDK